MIIKGNIYIVSAPSGAGKSSLIQALINKQLLYNIQVSISYTTRAIRPEEINGQHYFFVSVEKFERMISENAFLEYAQVFGNYYGTARENVEQIIATGSDIFLDIDWQGAQQIRQKIPNAQSIFILPPSKKELNHRLHRRGQDSEKIIYIRMAQAVNDINHIAEYDYLIINDNFNTALLDLKTIIRAKRLSIEWQQKCHKALINKLLAD